MENQVPYFPPHQQPMTLGEWIVTLLISAIPMVGIISLIIWASGSTTNIHKKTYAKAALIIYAIMGVASLILFVIIPMILLNSDLSHYDY
ncbi:hypothetical protein GCM10007049_22560 [Echinicola pacifica]|uniref:Uncharacterized protein n=1 Tax=Echinicola pacifica TaxID=346377 RepID=A0A918URB4_9BACT|nr:hypothetical protein [Echinicola pacifica]GGZ28961.1 hypothetical protein GCM10007049_22560 [Echinicola pacifica]